MLFDFTIQREMPGKMIVEVGYIGRLGRDLPRAWISTLHPTSSRIQPAARVFAQAYDAVALALRSGAAAATLPAQAWFENQLPGLSAAR